VSLYGELDEEGNEIDDIGSRWFIGEPIAVVFDYKRLGTWQLDEAEEAAVYGSEPGYAKGEDVDGGDGVMNIDDMQILGQRDPKFMGGMTNTFSYKNFSLDVFMYGVYGVTKHNFLMNDAADTEVALATRPKDWWTPDNPTNTYNKIGVFTHMMAGVGIPWVEDASFLRIKDVSLGYDVPLNQGARVDRLKVYLTGRNLYTFTSWIGTDPELPAGYGEHDVPIQMEFVLGVKVGF